MAIKKAYVAIASLLAANPDKTCSEIYSQFEALASAKTGGGGGVATSFHKNDDGVVVALHCAYHKQFFDPSVVEFGAKASAVSGFNTYSKDGMSKWTKQQGAFRKAKEQLLTDVMNGEVAADEIAAVTAELETTRTAIDPIDGGYDTMEDLLASL